MGSLRLVVVLVCFSVALAKIVPLKDIDASEYKSQKLTGAEKVITPFQYPLFKQCNSTWGNNVMENDTICEVGCLMSSVSMALNGKQILIDGQDANPGVLNSWLQKNGGYVGGDDLQESIVPNINPAKIAWIGPYIPNTALSVSQLQKMLLSTEIVIANVMEGRHFVLVTGFDETGVNWYVNDPGFPVDYYTYDQIVGWRIFVMS